MITNRGRKIVDDLSSVLLPSKFDSIDNKNKEFLEIVDPIPLFRWRRS